MCKIQNGYGDLKKIKKTYEKRIHDDAMSFEIVVSTLFKISAMV